MEASIDTWINVVGVQKNAIIGIPRTNATELIRTFMYIKYLLCTAFVFILFVICHLFGSLMIFIFMFVCVALPPTSGKRHRR